MNIDGLRHWVLKRDKEAEQAPDIGARRALRCAAFIALRDVLDGNCAHDYDDGKGRCDLCGHRFGEAR